jgi:hypothetical protein
VTPAIFTSSSYEASVWETATVWTTQRYVERPGVRSGVPSPMPQWEEFASARLAQLERLSPNWDAYGAYPVSRTHSTRAARFLRLVMSDNSPLPDVVPLSDGGVQLEWYLPWGRLDFVSDTETDRPVLLTQRSGEDARETSWNETSTKLLADVRATLQSGTPG